MNEINETLIIFSATLLTSSLFLLPDAWTIKSEWYLLNRLLILGFVLRLELYMFQKWLIPPKNQPNCKYCVILGLIGSAGLFFITVSIDLLGLGIFMIAVAVFHLSEYVFIAAYSPRLLSTASFLMDFENSSYWAALTMATVEYIVEWLYFNGSIKSPRFLEPKLCIIAGSVLVTIGEIVRKLAIATAKTGFAHIIQEIDDFEDNVSPAPLVRSGIYGFCRHPSYFGWFIWQLGMQLVLCNPICLLVHSIISWRFFDSRINYEEFTLLEIYGNQYCAYKHEVPFSGIPFIYGVRL